MTSPDETAVDLIVQLKERAKELNCLYQIEELLSNPTRSLQDVFEGIIHAIPPGWQYPEICQAEIEYLGQLYRSSDFVESEWSLSADVRIQDSVPGRITVYYKEPMPEADEGPFLKEEKKLISTISGRLSHFILHGKLKQMFEDGGELSDDNAHMNMRSWRVALDLLHRTDHGLFGRVSRKMMNYLCWRGIDEANSLLERYGQNLQQEPVVGEINQPCQKAETESSYALGNETFRIAKAHMDDDEILSRIQTWIQEDKSSFLIKALIDLNASVNEISDALRRYQHMKPHGMELSPAADSSARVALIRRFFSDQLDLINVAKRLVRIEDFFDVSERIIAPSGSRGQLGGKSAGLFLASKTLDKAASEHESFGGIRTPKTWYIASDGLVEFLSYNNLEEVHEQRYKDTNEVRQDYPHIVQLFKASYFPQKMAKGLALALDDLGPNPIIVRSSSLLEDRLGSVFSGKYKSLFLANQGSKKERLEALKDAVAEVYASTFSPDPVEYRANRGLLDFNEEMGILIQQVVGKRVGKYFMPAYAGVAFSRNELRWSKRIELEDGLLRLVPGLGTRAVDRLTDDYPVLVAPGKPGLRVNATSEDAIRYRPRMMDVLNLETNRLETVVISSLIRDVGRDYPKLSRIASIRSVDGVLETIGPVVDFNPDDVVITFDGLIEQGRFANRVHWILKTLERELGGPVDIEFASDGKDLYLLQCRPQSLWDDEAPAEIPTETPREDVLFTAKRYVTNGSISDISHIVYVDPIAYQTIADLAEMRAVGFVIGKLNAMLPRHRFVLIGPGRWGSRGDIRLGVRVTYADINNTAALIEVARQNGDYVPELSFGTHFFQDLVEASIRYLPLYPDDPNVIFNEGFFADSPNLLGELVPEFDSLSKVVRVIDVPGVCDGKVLNIVMNGVTETAAGYLADPRDRLDIPRDTHQPIGRKPDDHWRWRLRMAERIAMDLDSERFGVEALYVFGSVKNATAGPASDIDLLTHFSGDRSQKEALMAWFEGWSHCLDEINYLRTGYKQGGLLEVHFVTDEDIRKQTSYAAKIGAVSDAARKLPFGSPGQQS